MTTEIKNFILQETLGSASIQVPKHAALDFRQSYEPIGGVATLRMSDGVAVKQRHWRRWATRINGSGWLPPGVHDLNYDEPILLHCAAPRSITSSSPPVLLPGSVRSDAGHSAFGRALVDGEWITAGLGESVAGATLYQAVYFPILEVVAEPPRETLDADGAEYSWQISAEEA